MFYVPLLNRFTVEESEESVSNVTAERKREREREREEKKMLRLTERLHFGELNQLNGCGRAERKAG